MNGQTTAATSSSIIWLAQSAAPEALALFPQMTSSIGWPPSPPRVFVQVVGGDLRARLGEFGLRADRLAAALGDQTDLDRLALGGRRRAERIGGRRFRVGGLGVGRFGIGRRRCRPVRCRPAACRPRAAVSPAASVTGVVSDEVSSSLPQAAAISAAPASRATNRRRFDPCTLYPPWSAQALPPIGPLSGQCVKQ